MREVDYIVKLKQTHKSESSAIKVWLSEELNDDFNCDANTASNHATTLAVNCDNETIKQKLRNYNGDVGKVTSELISEFKSDFQETISFLIQLRTPDRVSNMIQVVELFIKECVAHNERYYYTQNYDLSVGL